MRSSRNRVSRTILNVVGILIFIGMVFPVYWMVNTSFKPPAEIYSKAPVPVPFTLDNYTRVFQGSDVNSGILIFARNSIIVTLCVVVISMVVAFLAATAVARFNFSGRKAYVILILAVQMVPFEALLISFFVMLDGLGMVNTLIGLMVSYLAFVLPFCIWTLRGFIANVPVDLEEAAMVDGLTRGQAFRKVLFPLIMPGLVATSVFAFIQAWNEFILANVILLSDDKYTLPLFLSDFQGGFKAPDWGGLMAASTLFAAPVIVFFLLIQKKIQAGQLAGGVKG